MDGSFENAESGDEALENLNVDAPAFVPGSPGISSVRRSHVSERCSTKLRDPIACVNGEMDV